MSGKSSRKAPSQRQLRVAELIRKALSDIFLRVEIQDPELEGVLLSVVEVSVSPDMRYANAYIQLLLRGDVEAVISSLERHAKFLRGEIARRVRLKYMPELRFMPDHTVEQSKKIDALLHSPKVAQDLNS